MTEAQIRQQYLNEGATAPNLVTLKDFVRFFAALSRGRIKDKPTADSINSTLEFFFAGFAKITGTTVHEDDRKELYGVRADLITSLWQSADEPQWVRKTLVAEGVVVNIRHVKQNTTHIDLNRVLKVSWVHDDLSSFHIIDHIQFNFTIILYMSTGARLRAFFTGGLRYQVKALA